MQENIYNLEQSAWEWREYAQSLQSQLSDQNSAEQLTHNQRSFGAATTSGNGAESFAYYGGEPQEETLSNEIPWAMAKSFKRFEREEVNQP
jgi:hypothetical protein